MANVKAVRVTREELMEHRICNVEFFSGSANFQGEASRYEYGIWCKNHQVAVGTVISIRGNGN